MKNFKWIIFAAVIVLSVSCKPKTDELIACGDDQVIVIDKENSDVENVAVKWNWKVADATDLPEKYQKILRPTDDCKPVDGGRKILVTSSGGGVVLIDRETKKSLFWSHSPMAHSAEMLPGNRIVVALSTHVNGNSIEVYDIGNPEVVVYKDSLYSGHGVVWMKDLKSLFALGYDELRRYTLKNWDSGKPELQLEEKWTLPATGGHDLIPTSDTKLILSTSRNVWAFDIPQGKFTPFGPLADTVNVKSVNFDDSSGELVYTKGEISWWTHNIYCQNPDKTIIIPGINLYKVRVFKGKS